MATKRLRVAVALILCTTTVLAQRPKVIDSLGRQLTAKLPDSTKMNAYIAIGQNYLWTDNDSALFYSKKGLALAKKLDNKRSIVAANVGIFTSEGLKRNDVVAIKTLFETQKLADVYNDSTSRIILTRFAGFLYQTLGDYRKSLQYFFELAAYKKNYWINDDYDVGFAIGQDYYELNVLDSALIYTNRNIEKYRQAGSDWDYNHNILGNIYRKMERYDLALLELHKALFLSIRQEYVLVDIIKAEIGLAQTFYAIGNVDSSLYYTRAAMAANNLNTFPNQQLQTFMLLKDIYKIRNNTDSAYKYTSLTLNVKDSIYDADKTRAVQRAELEQHMKSAAIENERKAYEARVKIYALIAALVVVLLIVFILIRNNRHKQNANRKIEKAYNELRITQAQLIQSEKMASLGELTAGIAHEIQNPLNFVNNFSEINTELVEELKSQKLKVKSKRDEQLEDELLNDIAENEQKINHHGKRADAIVKGMLQHSRASTGKKEPTDINALADEYLRLSYHGLRAKDKSFNATIETHFDATIGKIAVIPQDLGRVLLNLFNNAFYAVTEKRKPPISPEINSGEENYEPTVLVSTKRDGDKVIISVRDNGMGIPQKAVDKIFQPFFTTKPAGQGTGLGLSLSYDIIKAHGGEIKVESKEGEGAVLLIYLPA